MNLAPLTTAGQTLPCSRWAAVIEVGSGPVVASKRGNLAWGVDERANQKRLTAQEQ